MKHPKQGLGTPIRALLTVVGFSIDPAGMVYGP